MDRARRLTFSVSLLTGGFLLAAIAGAALAPTKTSLVNLAVGLAVAPAASVLGVLISRRRPENRVGLLLALLGLAGAFTVTKEIGWQVLADRPDTLESLGRPAAVLAESALWVLAAVALLLLYFPDGRVPGPRWRWVAPALVAGVAFAHVGGAFSDEPFQPPLEGVERPFPAPPAWTDVPADVLFFLTLGLVLACAFSLVVRYRRGDRLLRARIKWLALAGLGVAAYPLVCGAEILLWGSPQWFSVATGIVSLVGIPLATGVAVLRHDLYDVDKALAGAVGWGLLSVALLGVYAVSALSAGLVLGRGSAAAAAVGTAMCAVVLNPLRRRVQRGVDRRLYPLRRAARTAIDALHRDLGGGRARPEELQRTLRTALRDPALRVGYSVPGTEGFVDGDGAPVASAAGVPVELNGAVIGLLVPGGGYVSPDLLRRVADWSATLVEVVRLRLELAGALHEAESSRARLLRIGYEERRRLERDLHDGAQQRLVSLGMAIRLAQRHLDDGTVDVDALLDQSVAELGTAVAELRQIAHGLRPSCLDDGLRAALAALIRGVPMPVDVDVHDGVLSDDIATTAYYVVSEAVANAVKHAEANRVGIRVARAEEDVVVRVSDDGRGGAALRAGSGLADRVAAIGGSLRVVSPAGRGTVVEAVLPCVS
ncbi:histidine kinase [Streptomyces sp. NPDC051940]|uniref:sensor histidine kinase n=1 Tax=Streptomyces sp. NPDC051940 TaxID=3155675 RepID=UPI0034244D5E